MNKFTKISATALCALFLTACDKPASKPADAPKAEEPKVEAPKAETPAPAQATPAETAKAPEAAPASNEQGIADFKKIVDWNQAQEQALAASQAELQQKIATGDKGQIEAALTTFTSKVDEVLKSLDAVEVKDAAVAVFKEKTKQTLTLSNELIAESVKVMANPTAEAQQVIQEKSQVLIQAGQELQKLQLELQQKFAPAAK